MNTDLYAVSGTSPTAVQQIDRPAEAPQFKCPACPEVFPSKGKRLSHVNVAHGTSYFCADHSLLFKNVQERDKHWVDVHGAANPESTINKREQSSQSVEINLPGDPTAMGDQELAHFCADTFIKFATAIPFIIELQHRFKNKGKQWLQEVGFLGCSTWDQFCEKHFHRTRRAVNKAIAAFREQERVKSLPPAAVEPAPAPDSDSIPSPSPAPEAKSPHDKSPNGHDLFTLLSWLQKSIRRGHLGDQYVDDALYCAVELDLAGGTWRTALWNKLLLIPSEDIGQSDRLAVIESEALFLTYQRLKATSNPHKPERLPLIDCVLRLAMAPSVFPAERKSRMVDHALNVVYNEQPKRGVPDYVKDKHTSGSKMGVKEFFENESAAAVVDPDRWLEDAKRILIAKERPLPPDPTAMPSPADPDARRNWRDMTSAEVIAHIIERNERKFGRRSIIVPNQFEKGGKLTGPTNCRWQNMANFGLVYRAKYHEIGFEASADVRGGNANDISEDDFKDVPEETRKEYAEYDRLYREAQYQDARVAPRRAERGEPLGNWKPANPYAYEEMKNQLRKWAGETTVPIKCSCKTPSPDSPAQEPAA